MLYESMDQQQLAVATNNASLPQHEGRYFAGSLGATSALAAKASLSSVERVTKLPIVPNKFIVEVSDASEIPSKRALGTPHEQLYRSLRERKISFNVHKEYDAPGVFIGASLSLNNTQDVANILKADGVIGIQAVRTFPRPVWAMLKSQVSILSQGVDKLHAQGITGKGTDYTHPSLGGGFGPGFKVAGGFDLVGDDYTGENAPVPDPDPLDQCSGHGTHVAGIVGANPGNEFNISGVAYDATIFSYRIFGCTGVVQDDVIVDALLMGTKAGMDILTMSLGGADGWTESVSSVVSSRIAASGTIVTIAASNDGASGAWFTSSPGNAINAISVASSDNTVIPLQSLTVSGVTHDPITYYDTFPIPVVGTLPLYAISNDTTVVDDACNPLPASTPDLSGFAVLVRRGTCTFAQKLANIAAFGGNTTLIYDNGSGFAAIDVGNFSAVLIQAEDGVFLAQQFAAGAHIIPAPTGGLVSTFTSYGPTNDFFFKPAITAPGGNILSTFPVPLGSWALFSGTSMATPFMAGSAALVLSVKGALQKPISSSLTDGDPFQTAAQQGAGLVQVFDAIFGTTTLSRTELILNDTAHFAGPQKFTVKNTGKTVKTYTLSHVPAGTAVTFEAGSILPEIGPVPLSTDFASVTFNGGKFTLQPGQSHDVVATITPPKGVDATTFPVYSGFIFVTSGTESVHATYLGVAALLKNAHSVDDTDEIFGVDLPALLDSQGNVQDGPVNYTFAFGTPLLLLDLVSSDIQFTGTLNKRAPISFTSPHNGGTFAKVPTVGPILQVPWLGRNDLVEIPEYTELLENTFANGTVIPNGSYKVLLRSLRVTGDPKNEADYESWLSPVFGVAA
ncbi:subtilisin-like protease [Mycena olivaceomarginata]|nr:subtilisin-like protease [Mycena olivaceomarginata]